MKIEPNSKLRIRVESFNREILVSSCKKITDTINTLSINSMSLVHLPTSKKIYCVLRSPHVDKDSREHFEVRTYKRLLDIYHDPDSEAQIFKALAGMDLIPGVYYCMDFS